METFPVFNEDGVVVAFEVWSFLLQLRKVAKILRDLPDVDNVQPRRFFESSEDLVRFRFSGQPYVVLEPFGDSSRFWIGSKAEGAKANIDIALIEQAFNRASRFF